MQVQVLSCSVADPNFSIPDPGSKRLQILDPDPHQRIEVKKLFLSSRIRILIFLPIPDPGSRCQKGTASRIRIRNTPLMFNPLLTWKAFPPPLSSRSSVRQFPPPEHAAKHVTFCSIKGTVLVSAPAPQHCK
jgi:hypothetical protein